MAEHAPPGSRAGELPKRPFASPRLVRFLAGAVLLIGLVAAIAGVAYAINGATQTKGPVEVSVMARGATLDAASTPARIETVVLTKVPANAPAEPGLDVGISGAAQSHLNLASSPLTLVSWGSTMTEQLLSRGGVAVVCLCIGLGAVPLRRLLLSIADSRAFEPRNAARIAVIAGLVAVASLANDILPDLGSNLVLTRLGLTGPDSPIFADSTSRLTPLLVVPLLLALAEAFRRGTQLAQDVEGLV